MINLLSRSHFEKLQNKYDKLPIILVTNPKLCTKIKKQTDKRCILAIFILFVNLSYFYFRPIEQTNVGFLIFIVT